MQDVESPSFDKQLAEKRPRRDHRSQVFDFLQRSQGPGKARVDGQELDLNTGLILQEFQQAAGLHCLTADDVERRRNQ